MDRAERRASREDPGLGHAHLVGISGRGMSGLAQMLVQRGFRVSGSGPGDVPSADRLRRLGIRVHAGQAPDQVPRATRFLVYAPDVARDAPERLTARRRGVPQASHAEVLGRLMRRGQGVAIAGGRGASASAAMIGWVLTQAGLDPTVVLGTPAPQLGGWGRLGRGPHCVVEAVRHRGHLAPEAPQAAVVLGFGHRPGADREALVATAHRFVAAVPRCGYVLGSGRDAASLAALGGIEAPMELLALRRGCAWWGADLREDRGRYRFRAFHRGRFVLEARLRVAGRDGVRSALAAIAVCERLGVPVGAIKEGLEEFAGLARRLESRGSYRGVTLLDDEAEGPRAMAGALGLCRRIVGGRRLWAVVCPRDPSALAPFAPAFLAADRVVVAEAGPAGPAGGAWSLVRALASAGIRARWAADLDGAVADLDRNLEPGDVLLTLGAGDVRKVADALLLSTRRVPRDRQGR